MPATDCTTGQCQVPRAAAAEFSRGCPVSGPQFCIVRQCDRTAAAYVQFCITNLCIGVCQTNAVH
eukprot:2249181-Prymnesium_polylepis.1